MRMDGSVIAGLAIAVMVLKTEGRVNRTAFQMALPHKSMVAVEETGKGGYCLLVNYLWKLLEGSTGELWNEKSVWSDISDGKSHGINDMVRGFDSGGDVKSRSACCPRLGHPYTGPLWICSRLTGNVGNRRGTIT